MFIEWGQSSHSAMMNTVNGRTNDKMVGFAPLQVKNVGQTKPSEDTKLDSTKSKLQLTNDLAATEAPSRTALLY